MVQHLLYYSYMLNGFTNSTLAQNRMRRAINVKRIAVDANYEWADNCPAWMIRKMYVILTAKV